jgi:hypothetical protein
MPSPDVSSQRGRARREAEAATGRREGRSITVPLVLAKPSNSKTSLGCRHIGALLVAGALALGCHDDATTAPDASPSTAPPSPLGMASATTLVAAANPVEVLARLHRPKEVVLGKNALFAIDIAGDAPDPEDKLDIVSIPLVVGGSVTRVYQGQRSAEGLAIAGDRLVWITAPSTDGKEHARIVSARQGGAPATVVRTYDVDATSAVSDGSDAFSFGDAKDAKGKPHDPDVLRIGANGKAAIVATSAGKLVRTAMAINTTHVFWVQDGSIVRAPKAGGDASPVVKLPAGKIQRMAADDGAVYWTDSGTGDPTWSGRVYRWALAGGKVETLSDAPSPFAIALDGDTVYWTSSIDVGGRVLAQKKAGGATFVLAADLHQPRGLAVDDKYVYWIDTGDGNACRTEKTPRLAH